jgi:hypothetical protein
MWQRKLVKPILVPGKKGIFIPPREWGVGAHFEGGQ